jgi:hypothetical protein
MTRAEVESLVIRELNYLPSEKVEEQLDVALFLRSREKTSSTQTNRQRALGLLQGKATCVFGEDFSITDEEFLRL